MAETSPYLLGLTIIVSLVHSVFEFLAFKNGEFFTHKTNENKFYTFDFIGWSF